MAKYVTRKRPKKVSKKGYTTRKPAKKRAKKSGGPLGSGIAEKGRRTISGRKRQLDREIKRQGG